MSKLLNFTATATIGTQLHLGCISIVAGGAAAAAVITEIVGNATSTRCQLAAPANSMGSQNITDDSQGVYFDGVVVLSTLSGAGASVNIEMM